jgi:HEAT repeat protein
MSALAIGILAGRCEAGRAQVPEGRQDLASCERMLRSKDRIQRELALGCVAPLAKDDPAAVRVLIRTLKKDPHPEIRAAAADWLGELGPRTKDVIPALVETLTSDTMNYPVETAMRALGRIGPEAIPALVAALPTRDTWIGATLGEIGEPALPALIEILEKPRHRVAAVVGLTKLGPKAAPALSGLITALADGGDQLRSLTAHAIQAIGPPAGPAVPALIKVLDDPVKHIRVSAILALEAIGPPGASAAIPKLTQMASDEDRQIALNASRVLKALQAK